MDPTLYAYPRSFPKGLIDHLAQSTKIVPYLDIPLQHISELVLRRMRRGTNPETIRKRIAELREKLPSYDKDKFYRWLSCETEEDHQELIALKEAKFERVGAFIYSHEEGTPSYDLLIRLMKRQSNVAMTNRRLPNVKSHSLITERLWAKK